MMSTARDEEKKQAAKGEGVEDNSDLEIADEDMDILMMPRGILSLWYSNRFFRIRLAEEIV